MKTKLTIKLEERLVSRARQYAKRQNISLSRLVENYLQALTSNKKSSKRIEISPLVQSLTGVAADRSADFKRDYSNFLSKKYK